MFADRDQFSKHISKLAASVLLAIAVALPANAQSNNGIAPVNVPGRYVTKSAPTHSGTTGRYVSEPTPSAATARTSKPRKAPGRYVTGDNANTPAAPRATGPARETLSFIKQALPDIESMYGKRIHPKDVAALRAFYQNRYAAPLWVDEAGLTTKGNATVNEIADADNWGLSARTFALPGSLGSSSSPQQRAQAELKISASVLKYVRHARGGRINPHSISRFFDQSRQLADPEVVLPAIENSAHPDADLREYHPTHPQFALLQKSLQALRTKKKRPQARPLQVKKQKVRLPDGPTLRPGMTHPNVALLRKRLEIPAQPGTENLFDPALQAALKKFQAKNGLSPDALVGPQTRRTLNGKPPRKPASNNARIQKIVLNMERWRWMPRQPGAFYVFNNIPEFRTRIYHRGKVVYSEKIIVGKHKNPTPSFSADMKLVVFHPSWGVPNGIKKTEILPYLRQTTGFFGLGGADTRILKAHNLRVTYKGRPIDASKVNWSQVDIRNYTFIQPPSSTNVLGKVKFRFPNRHDVYMHDTPERHLFRQSTRAESHGCIRVQNPRRLAEIILEHDKGWSSGKVGGYWSRGGSVSLNNPIPVHTAYFTAFAGENGHVRTISDLYGYDGRVARALGKAPLHVSPDSVQSASTNDGSNASPRPQKPKKKKKQKKKKSGQPETVADIIHSVLTP